MSYQIRTMAFQGRRGEKTTALEGHRTKELSFIARAICICCLLGLAQSAISAERNVVLFVTDDQSPDMGCYGNPTAHTPHLDRLAKEGLRMNFAFCTTASCSASRSVILTGQFNHANAQYGHWHSYHHFKTYKGIRSLPVRLTAAGYRTCRIGKFHVGPEQVYKFETVIRANSRSPVEMANKCQAYISAKDKRPFFLYFCTSDPHRGGGTAKAPYNPNAFGNRPRGYPGVKQIKHEPSKVKVHSFLPDTPVCRAELAQYYQSCSRIDQGLGRLIELLKKAGKYDKTMVIFTADHGIAFPGAKTTLYEGGMRIPMIVRNPYGRHDGGQCNAMVNLADLTPTILDFAGANKRAKKRPKKTPNRKTATKKGGKRKSKQRRRRRIGPSTAIHGRSFLSALEKTNPAGWDEVYASHTFHEITMYYPMRVVRTRQYKLIWNIAHQLPYPFASDLWAAPTWQDIYRRGKNAKYGKRTVNDYIHRARFELYDVKNDPDEVVNLAGSKEHTPLLKQMKAKIRAFQLRTSDPWILKWRYE